MQQYTWVDSLIKLDILASQLIMDLETYRENIAQDIIVNRLIVSDEFLEVCEDELFKILQEKLTRISNSYSDKVSEEWKERKRRGVKVPVLADGSYLFANPANANKTAMASGYLVESSILYSLSQHTDYHIFNRWIERVGKTQISFNYELVLSHFYGGKEKYPSVRDRYLKQWGEKGGLIGLDPVVINNIIRTSIQAVMNIITKAKMTPAT